MQLNKINLYLNKLTKKISNIKNTISILSENLSLLDELSDNDVYNIHSTILKHYVLYYNKYCSIYLKMNIYKNIEMLKIVNQKDFNVSKFLNNINNDMRSKKTMITSFPDNININFNMIEATMININRNIKKITRYLTIKKTVAIIKNVSPINEKKNIRKLVNVNFHTKTIIELSFLNDEYNRFIGEIEINNLDINPKRKKVIDLYM